MIRHLLLPLLLLISSFSFAQVGIGTASPDSSAMLEVQSTTKGFLMPRMTTAERDAIANPALGLFIFNTDDMCPQYYKDTSWSTCLVEESQLMALLSTPRSCLEHLNAGFTTDGIYNIDPDGSGPAPSVDCYCDMTTEGGGWTLVASSLGAINDQGIAYHSELTTLNPTMLNDGIWDGMRPVIGTNSDIRFSASISGGTPFNVDLAFFDCTWYDVLTEFNNDNAVCFYNSNGTGSLHGLPARKNILNGDTRPLGDQWNFGYLESEDLCQDNNDFTVDFDDRGMDSNQIDGTDWGEDDNMQKCGNVQGGIYYYFVWVRE
jgi:hypothetical protein